MVPYDVPVKKPSFRFFRPPPINQSLVQRLNDTELVESMHSRSRIVRNQEWDPALAKLNTLNLAELVLSLLSLDAVDGEATLGVVDQAEVLAGLLDADDVHEASRVGRVGADLAVDLDQTLHHDGLGLAAVQGVLETIFAVSRCSSGRVGDRVVSLEGSYRLRMKTIRGRQSRSLWGPGEALGA